MRYSALPRVLSVLLAAFAIAAAGCGSSSKSSTTHTTVTPKGSHTTTVTKNGSKTTVYHSGEFCTLKKEPTYTAHGFKCVKVKGTYRLEKS